MNNNNGLSLPMILFLIFLVLKLCDVIKWNWLWVFSPLWVSLLLVIVFEIIKAKF